jgi:hypothetical protein
MSKLKMASMTRLINNVYSMSVAPLSSDHNRASTAFDPAPIGLDARRHTRRFATTARSGTTMLLLSRPSARTRPQEKTHPKVSLRTTKYRDPKRPRPRTIPTSN